MRFTVNAKELKTMIDKIMTVAKNNKIECFRNLYITVDTDSLKLFGTDGNQYLEVRSESVFDVVAGNFTMSIDDIKVLTKMTGNITLECNEEQKVNVRNGNKIVTIPKVDDNNDVHFPVISEDAILTVHENWLLETVANLDIFTQSSENKIILNTFHFNTMENRVEALDGYKIGTRTLANQTIHKVQENRIDTIKLDNKCVPVFKKLLDKKSDNAVTITQDNKFMKVEGKMFTYIVRRIDGEYFNTKSLFEGQEDYTLTVDKDKMLDVVKCSVDLNKNDKSKTKNVSPVVLCNRNNKLYAYTKTPRYETLEEIAAIKNTMNEGMYIGFNPQYLVDVFTVVDTDEPVCVGENSNISPMIVKGSEYKFLVLPVRIEVNNIASAIEKYM